jgi:hypothetical protein
MNDTNKPSTPGTAGDGNFAGKWSSYAATAAAAVSVGGVTVAEADIVYRDIADITVMATGPLVATGTSASASFYSAMDTQQVALAADPFDLNFSHQIVGTSATSSLPDIYSQFSVTADDGPSGHVRGLSTETLSRLLATEDIGAAGSAPGAGFRSGVGVILNDDGTSELNFRNREGFIGFQFEDADNNQQLGWVRVSAGEGADGFMVLDYAYTTAGEPLAAGQIAAAIPEPVGLGVLALGAVGVIASRRRRSETQG